MSPRIPVGKPTTAHPPPVSPPPVTPPPTSAFLPAAPPPVTRETRVRATAEVPLRVWQDEFTRVNSPVLAVDVERMWLAAQGVSALVLRLLAQESTYCAAHPLANTNNCLGLRKPGTLEFMAFYSPVDGVKELIRRWTDPTYRNGVYQPKTMTLGEMLNRYAPPSENPTEVLIQAAVRSINLWRGSVTSPPPPTTSPPPPSPSPPPSSGGITLPGLATPLSFSFPVHVALVPTRQTNQRPGIKLSPRDKYIQHETGNLNPGANALMHSRYLDNGAEGQQLSYHFTVDEREAFLKIPLDEVTWHGGDGGSGARCNYTSISCELCVQDNNAHKAQARRNAEELAGKIVAAANLTSIHSHAWCCEMANAGPGCHYACPAEMFKDAYFDQFMANAWAWARKGG